MIFAALNRVNGNRTKAARILGISVRTMRNKLQEYGGEGIASPCDP
jgi:DNA-binding NtrC family response regulator